MGTVLIAAAGAAYGQWVVDDAAITFDFARNIAEGHGSVAQPSGPRVEGYSNPMWLLLLLAGRVLGLFDHGRTLLGVTDSVLYVKALATLCSAGTLTAVYVSARETLRRPWLATLTAGAVLAATSSFVIWSYSGLENPMYAMVVVSLGAVLLRASVRGTLLRTSVAVLAGVLVFVAALTRPDGLIYIASYPLLVLLSVTWDKLVPSLRSVTVSVLAFAVPYGAFLAYRYAMFGLFVPNTAVAKSQSIPDLAVLGRVSQLLDHLGWVLVLGLAVCVGSTILAGGRARRALAAPLVVLGLALLSYAVLNPDWMPFYRFATPVWPLLVLVGVVAVPQTYALLDCRAQIAVGALLVIGVLLAGQQQLMVAQTFRATPTVPMCAVADVTGRGYNGLATVLGAPDPSLLTPDLGGAALTSDLRLVDLAGLVDPTIARFWGSGDLPGLRDHVLGEVRPTFMTISVDWANSTGLLGDPRVRQDYLPLNDTNYGPGSFVRRDALRSSEQLDQLRAYMRDVVVPAGVVDQAAPRRGCGTLARGQQLR